MAANFNIKMRCQIVAECLTNAAYQLRFLLEYVNIAGFKHGIFLELVYCA